MIIDASALLAVVLDEPDADLYLRAMLSVRRRIMPAATWFEASMALDRVADRIAAERFDDVVAEIGISLTPFTEEHAAEARRAWSVFGRGRRHPAKLNFGDCMVYAVAKLGAEPLLFKGNDFSQTDIEPALKG